MASVYASEANHSKNSPLVLDPVDHTEWNLARDVAHQRCIDAYVEEDSQRKGNDSCIHAILPCLPCHYTNVALEVLTTADMDITSSAERPHEIEQYM